MVTKPHLSLLCNHAVIKTTTRSRSQLLDFLRIDCTVSCLFVDVVAAAEVAVVAVFVEGVEVAAVVVEEEAFSKGTSGLQNML